MAVVFEKQSTKLSLEWVEKIAFTNAMIATAWNAVGAMLQLFDGKYHGE